MLDRLPATVALLTALAPLTACATGSGAGEGGGGAVAARRRVQVLDLMARKPDSKPMGENPASRSRGRKLDRAVSRTVESHRGAFQSCVERSSKQKGRVHTRATLLLTVRPDGVVQDARVAEKTVRAKPLGQCLVNASYRMAFPAFDGPPMQVKVPLRLTAE